MQKKKTADFIGKMEVQYQKKNSLLCTQNMAEHMFACL